MVSKKLSKNKASVTNNKISHIRKRKKAIFVSQKVIINSIFDKSLIDETKQVILPENLSIIYQQMISDSNFINDKLNRKDYSFYNCNLGFIDGERMISSKRKALVEFMLKEKSIRRKNKKIVDKISGETVEKRKNKNEKVKKEMEIKSENIVEIDMEKPVIEKEVINEEKDSELSSENNNNNNNNNGVRPQRKRKKPSKFKNEDLLKKRKDNSPKEKAKSIEDKEKGKENMKTIESVEETVKSLLKDSKIKRNNIRVKKEKEECLEIIDLIEENSSDSSEKSRHKPSNINPNTNSSMQNSKSKIYFREPVARKPTKLLHRRLKEHTLLDKILLGINCVRKWTEKGLHLSRLYETDLALLNKRLTSLSCILTDLQEHTDENNNRYLSVLLKSDLFSSFVLPSQPIPPPPPPSSSSSSSTGTTQKSTDYLQEESINSVSIANNSNEIQENIENVSYNRPKTKQHVPSLYRQRHGLPGILSKPQLKPSENKINFNDSSSISTKNDDNIFSHVKFEESLSSIANTSNTVIPSQSSISISSAAAAAIITTTTPSDNMINEPQMTASQLLKIKSQKSITDANQKRTQQLVTEPSGTSMSLPRFTLLTNGIVSDTNQTFYYQTANIHQRPRFPMYLLSNKTLISSTPNSAIQRQVCVPISNAFHSVSRLPLQKSNDFQKYSPTFIQPKLSQIPAKINSLPSKSVVLKNLLQQSNAQMISNSSNTIATNQMVPLSVFQNSQIKRQFLPINQSSFNINNK